MNKKEIQKKYKEKIKLIKKFNKFYYDKSDPLIHYCVNSLHRFH